MDNKKMSQDELVDLVRQKGEEFDPVKFREDVAKLMEVADPYVEANKKRIPSLETARTEIKELLPRLDDLEAHELSRLGVVIGWLERPVQEIGFFEGLGVKAIGRSLIINPNRGWIYHTLAHEASRSLRRDAYNQLYRKAYNLTAEFGPLCEREYDLRGYLRDLWPQKGEAKTGLEGLLARLRQKGEEFKPERFKEETEALLAKAEPYLVESEKNKTIPGHFFSWRDRILELLSRLNRLNGYELSEIGEEVSAFEQPLTEVRDLTEGLGAQAIGKALTLKLLHSQACKSLATIVINSIVKPVDKDSVYGLYIKAGSCPDLSPSSKSDLLGYAEDFRRGEITLLGSFYFL